MFTLAHQNMRHHLLIIYVTDITDHLDNSEEEKLSLNSELESVLTFYCKSKNVKYESNNGWLDILGPLVALRLERADLYNCFYAVMTKYIPR